MATKNRPKKTRAKVPKSLLEKNDHELMEKLMGKRTMREVDALLEEQNKDVPDFMRQQ